MTERKVVNVQSFVIEVDEDLSEEAVRGKAYIRLFEDPPDIESIETMEEMKQEDCEHHDIEWINTDYHGETICQDYRCRDCGAEISEVYDSPDRKIIHLDSGETEEIELREK